MRKHRADSNLKTLPEDQQAEIISRLEAKGGTQKKVAEWLAAEWDVHTSQAALSEFYSWFQMRRRFLSAETVTQDLLKLMKQGKFSMSAEEMERLGNMVFMAQAMKEGDTKTFLGFAKLEQGKQKLKQGDRKIDVEDRRVKLLEEKAKAYDQIKEATKGRPSADLTPEERQLVLQVMDESLGITNRK